MDDGGLPAAGTDRCEFLDDRGLLLRHGTSLSLMARAAAFLTDAGQGEFETVDPTNDWEKWRQRRPAFRLYYALLEDPARDGEDQITCAIRAVLDGCDRMETEMPPRPRLIIDYIQTACHSRNRGLGTILVDFVVETARMHGANIYVLALENSCPYWMNRGFALEENVNLNARLNVFSDTHLLRHKDDPADEGDTADLELQKSQQ